MQHIVLSEAVKPYDGRWEIDLSGTTFNTYEWGIIKRFSGYYMGDYAEGLKRLDVELLVALAVVALTQAGKANSDNQQDVYHRLASVPFDGEVISLDVGEDEEEDAVPPPNPSETNSLESGDTSAPDSRTSSEPLTGEPNDSGDRTSGSLASVPTRLVS